MYSANYISGPKRGSMGSQCPMDPVHLDWCGLRATLYFVENVLCHMTYILPLRSFRQSPESDVVLPASVIQVDIHLVQWPAR